MDEQTGTTLKDEKSVIVPQDKPYGKKEVAAVIVILGLILALAYVFMEYDKQKNNERYEVETVCAVNISKSVNDTITRMAYQCNQMIAINSEASYCKAQKELASKASEITDHYVYLDISAFDPKCFR